MNSPLSYIKFLGGCKSPKNLFNKRGEQVTVNCGKCVICKAKRQLRYQKQCNDMCSLFKYVYFYTLTYDEANVPRCLVRIRPNYLDSNLLSYSVYYIDKTQRQLKTTTQFSSTYGKCIHKFEVPVSEYNKFTTFLNQAKPTTNVSTNSDIVRVLDNTDLQKFIKRLRFQIADIYDEQISHYSVSEYGPRTFRPHFHGVLLFNSDAVARNIEKLVRQSWKYGDTDISVSRSCTTTSNYIAGYLNSFVSLPIYLQGPTIQPKVTHSKQVLIPIHREVRDYMYQKPQWLFERISFVKSSGIYDYIPTRSTFNILFPRCYNYVRQTDANARYLYSIYRELQKHTNIERTSTLTRYCITHSSIPLVSKFLQLLEIFPYRSKTPTSLYLSPDVLHCEHITDIDALIFNALNMTSINKDYYFQIYARIYSAIHLSKHFITFCCEQLPFEHVYNLTKQFNDYIKPQHNLRVMYENMEQYNKNTHSINYDIFYLQKCTPYFNADEETGELLSYCSYNEYLNGTNFLQVYFGDMQREIMKNIKHKELNEKNYLMFNT